MTFYECEIERIKNLIYRNQRQLDIVIGMRNYIDNNYHAGLSLNFLSGIKFISKYHLLRLFKRYYGQTPKQYLLDRQIENSKEYLKKGMSIAETCYFVEFESPCSFSTLFKSKTGLTPTEFKKEQLLQSRFDFHLRTLGN
ncbi:helix-turn-helix domain-containing protein [Pedobacter fastidiosus]|uniref:Helix-turn-helix transcriptional regulator n=1 Tax=Pedobacter fastidiosus TaxID=2765361 RepID=A0ABR7KYC3_9SPHI|nr:helix-turn-helix transcriptional regulator [Pedobacter fastidiosus]